jgi:hypothetical protein
VHPVGDLAVEPPRCVDRRLAVHPVAGEDHEAGTVVQVDVFTDMRQLPALIEEAPQPGLDPANSTNSFISGG